MGVVCDTAASRMVEKTLRLHECRRNPRPVDEVTIAKLRWYQAICRKDGIERAEAEYRRLLGG